MLQLHDCPEDGAKLSEMETSSVSVLLSNSTPACEGFYIHCLLHKQKCIVCNLNIQFYPIRDRKKKKVFDKDVKCSHVAVD